MSEEDFEMQEQENQDIISDDLGRTKPLEEARTMLSQRKSWIGCRLGDKRKNDQFDGKGPSLVVYVQKKETDPEQIPSEELVPPDIAGVRTDVVEPFSGTRPKRYCDFIRDAHRSDDLSALEFGKIHQLSAQDTQSELKSSKIVQVGNVAVLEDDNGSLITSVNGEEIIDLVAAYQAFEQEFGDGFDQVTFFADESSGVPSFDTSFHLTIWNSIKGIGLPEYDDRASFGTSGKLKGINFMHSRHLNRLVMLHEFAHQWCSFVWFREQPEDADKSDLLIQQGGGAFDHWNLYFDDDRSPMDYDVIDWQDNGGGRFTALSLAEHERSYCNLDLYLMGLLPPSQVANFFYLTDVESLGNSQFRAQRKNLNIQNIVWAEGERIPDYANSQKSFRNAFVLVTRNAAWADSYASLLDRLRTQTERDFEQATRGLAKMETDLQKNGKMEPVKIDELIQTYRGKAPIPDRIIGQPPVALRKPMFIGDRRPIHQLGLQILIGHSKTEDLEILLIGPDGTSMTVKKFVADGSQADPGELSGFKGKSAKGEWTLSISDHREGFKGELLEWTLRFSFQV
jgi:hypothetical protein